MTVTQVPELVPARMLNEYAYCPRLFFLEWVDQLWAPSSDTAEGDRQHRRVDAGGGAAPLPPEGEVKAARSVELSSEKLGIIAQIDLLEGQNGAVVPVDTKKGRPPRDGGPWEADAVQVCAQVLLLREHGYTAERGELFYAETRQRIPVAVTPELVARTLEVVEQARAVATRLAPPPPLRSSPKCPRCSLAGICLPDELMVYGTGDVRVSTGKRPSVAFRNGTEREVRPRLIIGADGRASTVRRQSGIRLNQAPATHVMAGLLAEGASRWPDDQFVTGVERDLQFYMVPQGGGRVRLYTCHANEQASRWAGRAGAQRFVLSRAFAACARSRNHWALGDVTPAGPCGTFSCEPTWCDEPFADGVVLLGDAGGYDDPVTGQGQSLALCDVRQLSELLLASADWTVPALRPYGEQPAERLRRMRRVSTTFAALMTTFTDAVRARRDRFYAASTAGQDHVRMALGAVSRGPDPARHSRTSSTNRFCASAQPPAG